MDDLAPRIKEMRSRIDALENQKLEIKDASREKIKASEDEIREYAQELKSLLETSSIVERKSFLRSWIKKIDLDIPQGGTIEYSLPLIPTKQTDSLGSRNGHSQLEVLSIEKATCRARIRT